MEEKSSSDRITRDIQLHITNLVENLSFSLNLTQKFEVLTYSIAKSKTFDSNT